METILRIHYLQQWFGLSEPAMEEALHDVPEFAKLGSMARMIDDSTILRFRHLLEKHDLAADRSDDAASRLRLLGLVVHPNIYFEDSAC